MAMILTSLQHSAPDIDQRPSRIRPPTYADLRSGRMTGAAPTGIVGDADRAMSASI
jgi:hypothetical protein